MASISRETNGRRTIQFIGSDKKRRSIRLGKMSQRNAEAIKIRVERIVATRISGHSLDDETARWLLQLDRPIYEKLASVGLVENRDSSTLLDFVEEYIRLRDDVKESTVSVWNRTRNHLARFFGEDQEMRTITQAQTRDFRRYLKGRGLAEDTVRRTCGVAKQFLTDAVERGLLHRNPFQHRDIPTATGGGDKSREFFISRELAEKVLNALPSNQWKLMFALARFGGLRCPSEVLSLKWKDIDLEGEKILVRSPKTEHHEGGQSRFIPMFPELRSHLKACRPRKEMPNSWVVTEYRKMDSSYATLLQKRLRAAGIEVWPKPWQNLRSSRETELVEQFPLHVVCAWIGNSEVVANKHYLQVTEDHFKKAVQNPVQYFAENPRNPSQPKNGQREKTPVLPGFSTDCENLREILIGRAGLEPATKGL